MSNHAADHPTAQGPTTVSFFIPAHQGCHVRMKCGVADTTQHQRHGKYGVSRCPGQAQGVARTTYDEAANNEPRPSPAIRPGPEKRLQGLCREGQQTSQEAGLAGGEVPSVHQHRQQRQIQSGITIIDRMGDRPDRGFGPRGPHMGSGGCHDDRLIGVGRGGFGVYPGCAIDT